MLDSTLPISYVPVLPLKDMVVFPQTEVSIMVGRPASMEALKVATNSNNLLLLVTQKKQREQSDNQVASEDLYQYATIGKVVNRIHLKQQATKVVVKGLQRVKLTEINSEESYLRASYQPLSDIPPKSIKDNERLRQAIARLIKVTTEFSKATSKFQDLNAIKELSVQNPSNTADKIASILPIDLKHKINILKQLNTLKRCTTLIEIILIMIETTTLDHSLNDQVKQNIDKTHRDFFLNEKMKVIRQQLGNEDSVDELELLKEAIDNAELPEHAHKKATSEFKKLSLMPSQTPEASVIRNYIDTLLNLPWNESTEASIDITKAENLLNKDHYGLEEVKELILEHLAVQQRTEKTGGRIICLVGPPGVGKTSLAESIARATGRNYVRMALGGVRDEAEIRGHRRTYIGSMPGKILQKITQSKVKNPLFLLDEIDKMSMDFRGDPASALLEVLDPEQNHSFSDHYLEIEYDLSEVLFIATSNSYQIPEALLDRMDIIELSGYTDIEKQKIAKNFLLPKQKKKNGLKNNELHLTPKTIPTIIQQYTREAGVRSLERKLAKLCRKTVHIALTKKEKLPIKLTDEKIIDLLGAPPFQYNTAIKKNQVGIIVGLAWNRVGGDILTIETASYPGKGKLTYTGKLGEVMQESMQTAYSLVRSYHLQLGIDPVVFTQKDIHIHVPEGATPKDGPSAGLAITLALASNLSNNPILSELAVTGEITLRGEVLPIGGLKQKLLAAKRSNLKTVIIPEENRRHLTDIPEDIIKDLTIHPVKQFSDTFSIAFAKAISPAVFEKKNVLTSTKKIN
jgi:ATP-dependent Lon protease